MPGPEGYTPPPEALSEEDKAKLKTKGGLSGAQRLGLGALGLSLIGTAYAPPGVEAVKDWLEDREADQVASKMVDKLRTEGEKVLIYSGTVELSSTYRSFDKTHPLLEVPLGDGPTVTPTILDQTNGYGIKLENPVIVERPDGPYYMVLQPSEEDPNKVQPVFVQAIETDNIHVTGREGSMEATVAKPKQIQTPDGHSSMVAQVDLGDGRLMDVGVIIHDSPNSPAANS